MRKLFAVLLIVSLTLINLFYAVSCNAAEKSDDKDGDATTAGPDKTEGEVVTGDPFDPQLPVSDFDGYEFRMLTNDHESLTWAYTTMTTEAENGEPINDAVYRRNSKIENDYGVKLKEIKKNFGAVKDTAKKSILSGVDEYDIIIEDNRSVYSLMTDGLLKDISKYPNLNYDKPWWDKASIRDLSIGSRLFYAGGDMCLAHYDSTCAITFNKQLIKDNGLSDPYKLVNENNWTFDTFGEMIKSVSSDLDGDGKYTKEDLYGFASLSFVFYPSFVFASGEKPVTMNADGKAQLTMNGDRFIQVFEKLNEIMHGDYVYDTVVRKTDHRLPEYMFKEDKNLFFAQLIYWTTQLRDMESDFGIIPFPKFDTKQDQYYSLVFAAPLFCVPSTNTNDTRTGIIVEALCAESRRNLIPAYYDTTMKNKVSRDEESIKMLGIIFGSRVYDITAAYWGFIEDGLISLFEKNDNNLASYIDKTQAKADAEFEKAFSTFSK